MKETRPKDDEALSGTDRVAAAMLRGVMRGFAQLGPTGCRRAARPLAALLWAVNARRRHTTRCNLAIAFPTLDEAARERLAADAMRHYVRNILEGGMAWYAPAPDVDGLFEAPAGLEHLRRARQAGRGVIIAAPHFGAWELLALYLHETFDGGVLYKPGRNAALTRLLLERRSRRGVRMLPANRSGLRQIYASLHRGQTVGVLPDQEPSAGQGRFAPLFSRQALTAVLIPRLVLKTGARVVFAVAVRTADDRYRTHFIPADEAIGRTDIDTALAALNDGVERCIALDPAQYLWAYKRWRHRPPGDPAVY